MGNHPAVEVREDVRAYVERKREEGTVYLKSARAAKELDLSPTHVGMGLRHLYDTGEIDMWNNSTNSTVWQIADIGGEKQ